jgi:hypothetical protein
MGARGVLIKNYLIYLDASVSIRAARRRGGVKLPFSLVFGRVGGASQENLSRCLATLPPPLGLESSMRLRRPVTA